MACCSLVQIARDGRQEYLDFSLDCQETQGKFDALDKEGFAPLHYAARFNRIEITMKLLKTNQCGKIVALLFSLLIVCSYIQVYCHS